MHDPDERLLRSLFGRVTVGEEPPLGSLIDDALRTAITIRRRRRLSRAAGALGAAAVLAAAIPALGAATGAGGGAGLVQTTAFAVSHVEKAVARAGYVLHAESVVMGAGAKGRVVTWAYLGRTRNEQYRPGGGQLETDSGTAVVGGKLAGVVVTYHPGTWYRMPLDTFTSGPVSGCGPLALAVTGHSPSDWPSFIRAALACGAATVTGHAKADGVNTLKINTRVSLPPGDGFDHTRLVVRYTLYVSPATYLPARMVSQPVLQRHGQQQSPASFSMVEDFQWLPPTAANVAKVSVPIPVGFPQLHVRIHS